MSEARLNTTRSGSGEPLVLIHGTGSNLHVWRMLMPALERGHEVLALDLPGHGETPPLERDPTPQALAAAVAEELDRLGWDSPTIVGHSLGGWIALELAGQGRARSVAALAPSGGWTTTWERWYAEAQLRSSLAGARLIAPHVELLERLRVLRPLQLGMLNRPWAVPAEDLFPAIESLASAPSGQPATLHQVASQVRGLERIGCPVLLLWGDSDRCILPRQAHHFERSIADVELRWLEGIGHAPQLECPSETGEAIVEFVGRVRGKGDPEPAGRGA